MRHRHSRLNSGARAHIDGRTSSTTRLMTLWCCGLAMGMVLQAQFQTLRMLHVPDQSLSSLQPNSWMAMASTGASQFRDTFSWLPPFLMSDGDPEPTGTSRRHSRSLSAGISNNTLPRPKYDRYKPSRGYQSRKSVAYAISLMKCGDARTNIGGLTDAAAVLKHSIYQQHQKSSSSYYEYEIKLYAFVHVKASKCSTGLQNLGYHVLLRDTPVKLEEIQDEELRINIPRSWCCGGTEYIKLYSYTLVEHDLVVHVDVDFLFTKPMDDLFDAMLLGQEQTKASALESDTKEVAAALAHNLAVARSRIPLERPTDPWPTTVEAAFTRDWPQVIPGRIPGFQAGFLLVRPSMVIFEQIIDTIKTAKYVAGYSRSNGWGGKVRERDNLRLHAI